MAENWENESERERMENIKKKCKTNNNVAHNGCVERTNNAFWPERKHCSV